MAKIGYMRVSTDEQKHSLQREALERYGCDQMFQDTISGSSASRIGLDACLASLQPGDSLIVWKLDRLGRKVINLHNLVEGLNSRNISFVSLTENLDTTTICGRAMFGIMAVFAQMERETIAERVRAGLAAAKAEGRKLGPKFKITGEQVSDIIKMEAEGMSQNAIAKASGISQPTVCRILSRKTPE